jgi:uncharacterized protein (TIGR00730 family)
MRTITSVCVFCGSAMGADPRFAACAAGLGALLASRGITLVYGGATVGLMGVVADAVLAGGGRVIGVIPRALAEKEIAHRGLTELSVVSTMHERKALMASKADAFVAMPGGLGTLDELFEITTWAQLGLHDKPVGVLDPSGYYDGLFAFLARAEADGLVRPTHRALLAREPDPARLLDRLASTPSAPPGGKHESASRSRLP